jgi:hypothetical protein
MARVSVSRSLLRVAAIAAIAVSALLVAGCALLPAPTSPQGTPGTTIDELDVSVGTPDGLVGVAVLVDGLHLVFHGKDTGPQFDDPPNPSVKLFGVPGDTGQLYNTFVYGLAPAGAKTIVFDGFAGLVEFRSGLYIAALRESDIDPTTLRWQFLAQGGAIVLAGEGVTPTD